MTTNFLFLCTHNSARSVLAECMFNHLAQSRGRQLRGFSAGSTPSGKVKPMALDVLNAAGIDTSYVRSKSWDEFAASDALPVHAVITVCDSAAAEQCPIWPGVPVQTHWGYPDPSNAPGTDDDRRVAFELTRQAFGYRLLKLVDSINDDDDVATLGTALDLAFLN